MSMDAAYVQYVRISVVMVRICGLYQNTIKTCSNTSILEMYVHVRTYSILWLSSQP